MALRGTDLHDVTLAHQLAQSERRRSGSTAAGGERLSQHVCHARVTNTQTANGTVTVTVTVTAVTETTRVQSLESRVIRR